MLRRLGLTMCTSLSLPAVPATSSNHAARALLAEPRSAEITSDAASPALPMPPVPSAAPLPGPQTRRRPDSESERIRAKPAPQTSLEQAVAHPNGVCKLRLSKHLENFVGPDSTDSFHFILHEGFSRDSILDSPFELQHSNCMLQIAWLV